MSRRDKLIVRFLGCPKDLTFQEYVSVLGRFGYYLDNKGKTSGSGVAFRSPGRMPLYFHKPHGNGNFIKRYVIVETIRLLKKEGLL